jgi:hypothetical protein
VDAKLKESVESTLQLIEERIKATRVEKPLPQDLPESKANTEPVRIELETPPNPQPVKPSGWVSRPTLTLEGTQTFRGLLVAIECSAGKWTLGVRTADKRIRFMVSNKAKLEFFSQDPDFKGAIRCGPVNKNAFIYFKPITVKTTLAGDAVAVEFIRD